MRSESLLLLIFGAPSNTLAERRLEGTPSLGEVPSVGAKAFWLLLGLSKSDPP